MTSSDTSAILKWPLFGSKELKVVSFPVHYRRFYPYGELAKRTLGSINLQSNVRTGLEERFNKYLAGEKGSRRFMMISKIKVPLDGKIEATDGYNIQTTLNLDIQYIAYQCLMDKLLVNNAEWGTVVVMETKTGGIKAISNLTRTGTEGNYQYNELCRRRSCLIQNYQECFQIPCSYYRPYICGVYPRVFLISEL